MTAAQLLFVSILKRKDEKTLAQLNKDWLDTSEIKQYHFITDYYKEHGELPGIVSFTDTFKIDSAKADSRPALYLKQVKERFIFSQISEEVPPLLRKVKDNPTYVLSELKSLLTNLDADRTSSKDSYYSEDTKSRIDEYLDRVKNKGVTYLSMGNTVLDEVFYGYRKGDLITIGGRAGSRKTWLITLLAHLVDTTLPETYGDILVVTNEMPSAELKERLDCIRFGLPYESFMKGKLSRHEITHYKRGLEDLATKKSRICFVSDCLTIDELTVKVNIHKPSVVFIDGSYLMEPKLGEGWEKITAVTRSLKRLAKTTEIPIVNTTQLRRSSGKSDKGSAFDAQDEFAYSNSYVQDSDLALRMFQTKDMVFNQEFGIQVAKGRRVRPDLELKFCCNLSTMSLEFNEGIPEPPTIDY